jgi:hypothetical protein
MIDIDFHYTGIEIDYDRRYSCKESGCDDICRCSQIINAKIKSINYNQIIENIYDNFFDKSISTERDSKLNSILFDITKEVDLYTIDRITRIFKLWDKSNWNINIEYGFYGEEIESITINDSISKQIDENIKIAFSIQDLTGRIQFLLGLEYGYLIPELEKCKFEVIDINKSDLIFGSDSQLKKVKGEKLEHYNDFNYNGIKGVVAKKGDKWRLIDGYHRCFKSKSKIIRVISAVID